MAFMVKHVVGGQLKNLTGGLTEEKSDGDKTEAAAKGMTQEEFEQYQQQLEEENQTFMIFSKVIKTEDNQEEEQKQSVLGHLTNIQNVDMGHLKGKAQATLEDLKNSAEKCCVM
ncbi:complexin-3-like [Sinocyclocheilus grahami]|uniref:complexin-3-like n=1 Tax=Sinocyclocheilus grahami TaxID=75366 RepID=UPI0007AC9FB8|nr:PREDICTED: complexin-3-like [Sinocyclocheilus grahami]